MTTSPHSGAKVGGALGGLLRGMRPTQWTKNLLVFAAPVAGGVITQAGVARDTVLAFVIFCLASGGTYLLNDARDVEADKLHPTKRHRPVASGQVPVSAAYAVGVALLAFSVAAAFTLSTSLGVVVVAYLTLTTAYSFALKNFAVVDLVAVAAGFVLRAAAGSAATGVPLSEWFLITVSAGALLVVTAKREAELARTTESGTSARRVLADYTPSFLHSTRTVAAGLVLAAYCLWAFAAETEIDPLWAKISLLPFVTVTLRYSLLADKGLAEKPEKLLLTDPVVLVAGALWGATYLLGVYLT